MVKLKGHYDGNGIVLDEPVPADTPTNAKVEVVLLPSHDEAFADWRAFHDTLRQRPAVTWTDRTWKREDLYERG